MEKGDVEKPENSELGNPLYCSYEDGQFIYKDPTTNNRFVWNESEKKWIPKTVLGGSSEVNYDPDSATYNYKDSDGTTFEWEPSKAAWFPKGRSQGADLSTTTEQGPRFGSGGTTGDTDPSSPPPSSGFHNPNYDSSLQSNQNSIETRNTRRFYYAALSPTDMGVNEPCLFLSPDDQVNNNSTIPQDPLDIPGLSNQTPGTQNASGILPIGWERHDDSNGPYYWHIKSGTIQRDPPTHQQNAHTTSNPALLIPGSLQSSTTITPFRRSQTISSQLSSVIPQSNANSTGGSNNKDSISEKRKSWSQYLENNEHHSLPQQSNVPSSNSQQVQPPVLQDKPLRFIAVSLGCLSISEEDLTPERSSRAVSKVIAELTNPNSKIGSAGLEVAGKIWGGGNELYLELDDTHLRVKVKDKSLTVLEQPIHSIRVWGVGREDPRDFAFVAREKQTRQFLCHVFRLEMYARPLANSLRDACKKIMIERQAKQKRPTTLPTGLRKSTTTTNNAAPTFFPTPMDEPRKVLKAYYLGSKAVNKPTGVDTLNAAIDALGGKEPLPVQVSVAPSVIKIVSEESDTPNVDIEVRVRFLSFLGIGTDIKTCGIIVHTARDDFEAHCFYSNPSTGALCKAIEAACVLRYQKCLDAHHVPTDDEFLARYHINYGTTTAASTSSTEPLAVPVPPPISLKASEDASNEESEDKKSLKRKLPPSTPEWFDVDESQNSKVYVSNLPTDLTEEEFLEFMGKCGLVMKDPTTGLHKIKMYEHNGTLKGDALCHYIKVESVDLALQILDGAYLRNNQVKVERAKFTLKGQYDPTKKPKQKKRKDKEKLKKKQEALFAWKPEKLRGERPKHEKAVVVKNAFTPEDFNNNVELILELKEDFREESAKFGNCRRVEIYDAHPEGVVQIFMSSPVEADAVVNKFHGRFFGGKRLTAELYDGITKYNIMETDAERDKRLAQWEKYISEDDPENSGNSSAEHNALAVTPPRE